MSNDYSDNSEVNRICTHGVFDEQIEAGIREITGKSLIVAESQSIEDDRIGNRPVFIYCQYLGGLIPMDTGSEKLKPYVRDFHQLAEHLLDEMDFVDVFEEFCDIWDNKRFKFTRGSKLEKAIVLAKNHELPRREIKWEENENGILLCSVCYELSEMSQDGTFFLSGYDAGEIIERTQRTGRLKLDKFCKMGLLTLVKKGTAGQHGMASTYRYNKMKISKAKLIKYY